ncbi:hypothetical protein ABZP36_025413 [Zizania latifolia]
MCREQSSPLSISAADHVRHRENSGQIGGRDGGLTGVLCQRGVTAAELAPPAAAYSPSNALSTPEEALIDPVEPVEALETPSYGGGSGNGSSARQASVFRPLESEVFEVIEAMGLHSAGMGCSLMSFPLLSGICSREDFEEYAEKAKTLPENTSNENKLILYGLYKQATVGDVNTSRPGIFNQRDRAKWDAWKAVEGKSMEEAMSDYVTKVKQLQEEAAAAGAS